MVKLTHQEEEVMLVIWNKGEGFIKDYLEAMSNSRPPYTTLASVVKNLERKGFVESSRYGNTYRYRPLISEEQYKKGFLSNVVRHYFENSYKEMVTFFARENKISPEELQEIIKLIEQQKK